MSKEDWNVYGMTTYEQESCVNEQENCVNERENCVNEQENCVKCEHNKSKSRPGSNGQSSNLIEANENINK